MPVGIALSDLPIAAVDKQLRTSALGCLPSRADRGGLSAVVGRVSLRTFPADCPLVISWNNVNITLHEALPHSAGPGFPTQRFTPVH